MSKVEAILQLQSLRERCKSADNVTAVLQGVDDVRAIDVAIDTIEQSETDGCVGCVFGDVEEWELPCRQCARGCKDYWRGRIYE